MSAELDRVRVVIDGIVYWQALISTRVGYSPPSWFDLCGKAPDSILFIRPDSVARIR